MQTAQAYTTSLAISNTAVNLTFSILIVLSAVVHPVLSRLYSRQPAMKRFACVLSEFFIDLAWGNILPPYIAIMYAPLDRTTTTDQIFKLFDYGFYEKAQREVHQLLILSWPAFLISVFTPGYVGIVIFGIGVWLVSIASTSLVPKTGRIPDGNCIHRLSPWLVADDACVVVIVHCPTLQITGRQAEMNSVLSTVHLSSLSHLLISSCNELEKPTSLSHADTLLSLVFVNNTILDWPREIAFSSEYFPRIMNAAFIFSRVLDPPPPGLVDIPYWPRRLERVYFSYTDIDELAQRFTTQWSTVVSWIGVNCGLKTFPLVFFTMPNLKIWAVYNSTIPSIPTNRMDEVVLGPRLTYAMWTFNPQLTSIGDDLWRAAASGSMQIMSLAFTNVSTIPPQWQKSLQNARFPIHAVGSPLCSANVSILPIPAIDCNPDDYNPRNVV
ncbi:hypothetical protein Poli38472_001364 [Pythium oligandrum]|uniref:Uncharacterized protein n=1 Tax=Pythium oligandrum TaxID=41045 RepID=A0A8K1FT44_PYTOL|nr:hypothetical protein Poli38472_001364 [Pythium oligandrum]|eukprot:TMW69208.1 hypothetical protein Poli38472_001364 [Pythium oligandrum]